MPLFLNHDNDTALELCETTCNCAEKRPGIFKYHYSKKCENPFGLAPLGDDKRSIVAAVSRIPTDLSDQIS